ncbi:MAG: protein kinase, partial [Vicinamibacteria bacterium]|nr:protein kinase [Vicinamibacteria bacterium]
MVSDSAADPPAVGDDVLSHYQVLDKLGEGGMGVLYRARDNRLERTVAIKMLRPDTEGEESIRWRFVQEARAASALNHPNIVTIYEIDRQAGPGGADFIVMEYIDGQPISKVIAGRRLDAIEALGYALPVASALAAAHAAGIVHRDVKPANVMVTDSGQVKVLDFGLAKLQSPPAEVDVGTGGGNTVTTGPRTTDGMILGTPAYMSPEQAQGQPVDARSDVFSLGAMLYVMLAGRRPFLGDNQVALLSAILRDHPPTLRSLRADLPKDLEALVHRCLEKDREKRPSAQELSAELAAIQRRLLHPVTGLGAALRRKAVAVPLVLVLIAAMVGAVFAWRRVTEERWARQTVMPQIARLAVDFEGAAKAFRLAREIEPIVGDDPRFQELFRQVTWLTTLETDPPGVAVSYKDYLTPKAPWQPLGRTPLKDQPVPASQLRWRFEKDGYEPAEAVFAGLWPPSMTLVRKGAAPSGMVRVPAGAPSVVKVKPVKTEPFWLDRYEVTNAEYKKFVDGGGYRRPDLWKHAFLLEGRTLSREQALARLVDTTWRPGPAN